MTKNTVTETRKMHKSKRKKRSNKSVPILFKAVLIVVLIVVLGAVAYAAKILTSGANVIDDSVVLVPNKEKLNANIDPIKDPIAVLIMGIDNNQSRNLENTRTDSIMLLTMSPADQTINLVSIPRDTYTYINVPNQFEGYDKINSAYAYGEASTTTGSVSEAAASSIDAVEYLMDTTINYYVTIDFNAFESIINAFGGVKVEVPYDITEQNAQGQKVVDLEEGFQTLNGEEALAFARTRDYDNDIERGKRQQEVLKSVINEATNLGSITKMDSILQALEGHFWTNIDRPTMMKIAESGIKSSYELTSYPLSWMSFDYYGGNYVGIHRDSLAYVSHKLNVSLGTELKDERDELNYIFETDGQVSEKTFPMDGMAIVN